MTAAAPESREPAIDEDTLSPDRLLSRPEVERYFGISARWLEPQDAALAQATIDLVAHGEFAGAMGLLRRHLAEKARDRETETERDFRAWYDLPADERPPFWDWAYAEHRSKGAPA